MKVNKRNPIASVLRNPRLGFSRRVIEDKRRKVDVNLWKRERREHLSN